MGDYMAKVRAIMADDFDRQIRGGKDDAIFSQINRTTEQRAQMRLNAEQEKKPAKGGAKAAVSWVLRYLGCLACLPCVADFVARDEKLLAILSGGAFFAAFISLVMDAGKTNRKE